MKRKRFIVNFIYPFESIRVILISLTIHLSISCFIWRVGVKMISYCIVKKYRSFLRQSKRGLSFLMMNLPQANNLGRVNHYGL